MKTFSNNFLYKYITSVFTGKSMMNDIFIIDDYNILLFKCCVTIGKYQKKKNLND